MDTSITLPLIGPVSVWLTVIAALAILIVIRFIVKLIVKLVSSAAIFAIWLWLGPNIHR